MKARIKKITDERNKLENRINKMIQKFESNNRAVCRIEDNDSYINIKIVAIAENDQSFTKLHSPKR